MVNPDNFLDIWDVLANELIGSVGLTVLVGLVIITLLCNRFRLPVEVTQMLGILWIMMIFAQTKILILWVFAVLIVGFMYYYIIAKLIED